jgi:hypothetical protein
LAQGSKRQQTSLPGRALPGNDVSLLGPVEYALANMTRDRPTILGDNWKGVPFMSRSAWMRVLVCLVVLAIGTAALLWNHEPAAQAAAFSANPVGSWYGVAVPRIPETSPFPAVVMTPTFFADGNVIANDSHELTSPHATAHGNWVHISRNGVRAVFVWLNLANPGVEGSGFNGSIKVVMEGKIEPPRLDNMTGTLHAFLFPPGTNPLDPAGAGGIDLGVFDIVQLQRIRAR